MELDPEWYAYQCKSGEVLFYYNVITGVHRWSIHFCSCLKSKIANSTTEPCCLWQPVKSQSSESGKFVRSIGTETEEKYFAEIQRNNIQQSEEIVEPSRTEITFEYSVSKDNEDASTETSYTEKPVEVFLEDPFVLGSDKQNISSKCLTLNLKEISRQELSLVDNTVSKKLSKRVDDLTFPRKSMTVSNAEPVASGENGEHSSEISSFVGHLISSKKEPLSGASSLKVSSPCPENARGKEDSLGDILHVKRQRGSTSSRKNPEPKKLLKRNNSNVSEKSTELDTNEVTTQEYFEDGTKFDEEEDLLDEDAVGEPPSSATSMLGEQGDCKDDADDQFNICELCGKDCATPAMLTNHLMKHRPTGTTCPICNKYFSRRQGLRYHVQTHAGDKPHACKICSKSFTKSASLVAHNRTHSGIRPFKCSKCHKGFTHSSNLSSHLRIHSSLRPYQCKFCPKGFKTSSHLTLHLRCHSNERPYECSECGKAFKNSSHLRSHEKLHRMPKTDFCNSCGEGFRSFSHLMYHQQTNPMCNVERDDKEEAKVSELPRTQQLDRNEVKHEKYNVEKQEAHGYSDKEMEEASHIENQRLKQNVTNEMQHGPFHMEEASHIENQRLKQNVTNEMGHGTFHMEEQGNLKEPID